MPPAQSKTWCYTLNNYTEDDERRLNDLYELGGVQYHCYGRERSLSGTPHLQGFIRWTTKKRFNAVKSAISDRGHIEPAVRTDEENRNYCSKDGDFREWGTPISRTGGSVCQFTYFRDWCRQYYDDHESAPPERAIADAFPALYVRYRRNVLDLSLAVCPSAQLMVPETVELRGWQRELVERLSGVADDRTVDFYIDLDGGKGKSYLQRYLLSIRDDVQCLGIGKRDDLAYAINTEMRIFLFNIPRGGTEYLQYTILEQLKDRLIFSNKYESHTKQLRHVPHVVVFTNEDIDRNAMSRDRYNVIRLI